LVQAKGKLLNLKLNLKLKLTECQKIRILQWKQVLHSKWDSALLQSKLVVVEDKRSFHIAANSVYVKTSVVVTATRVGEPSATKNEIADSSIETSPETLDLKIKVSCFHGSIKIVAFNFHESI